MFAVVVSEVVVMEVECVCVKERVLIRGREGLSDVR